MAIYAVSDIKGNFAEFLKLLESVKFNENPNEKDVLFILGNFIGETNCIIEEIEYIMQNTKEKRFYPVIGAYEEKLLKAFSDNDYLTQEKLLKEESEVSYLYVTNLEVYRKHMKFLKSLPYYYLTDEFMFSSVGKNIEDGEKLELLFAPVKVKDRLSVYSYYDAMSKSNGDKFFYDKDTNSLCINTPKGGNGKGYLNMIRLDDMKLFSIKI